MKYHQHTAPRIVLSLLLTALLCFGGFLTPVSAADPVSQNGMYIVSTWDGKGGSSYTGRFYDQLSDLQKTIYLELAQQSPGNLDRTIGYSGLSVTASGDTVGSVINSQMLSHTVRAFDAYFLDNPGVFWLDTQHIRFGTTGATQIAANQFSVDAYTISIGSDFLAGDQAAVNAAVAQIASGASAQSEPYSKVRYIHDALASRVVYGDSNGRRAHSIAGALVDGMAVCEGYAKAFQAICDAAGIHSELVVGTLNDNSGMAGPHAWNIVEVDGGWYIVDVTNNDYNAFDALFLIGTGHTYYSAYTEATPSYYIAGQSYGDDLIYPTVSTTDYAGGNSNGGTILPPSNVGSGTGSKPGGNGGSGGSSGGGYSGGGGGYSGGALSTLPTSSNVGGNGTVLPSSAAKEAEKALASSTGGNPLVKFRNARLIEASTLESLANKATAAKKPLTLQFDTTSTSGGVLARITADASTLAKAGGDVKTGVQTDSATVAAVKNRFAKFFQNKIQVVSLDHKGAFGGTVRLAVKLDLSKMDTKNLVIYYYSYERNSFKLITDQDYRIDENGYVHVSIERGGEIVFSEGALVSR